MANYKLYSLATNERDIATCGFGKEILIFDRELHLKQTLQSETTPAGLAYSPNGESLVAGRGSTPNNVNIYDTKSYKKRASFTKHKNLTKAVNFIDNNRVVSGGGDNKEIFIWDKKSAKEQLEIVGM